MPRKRKSGALERGTGQRASLFERAREGAPIFVARVTVVRASLRYKMRVRELLGRDEWREGRTPVSTMSARMKHTGRTQARRVNASSSKNSCVGARSEAESKATLEASRLAGVTV